MSISNSNEFFINIKNPPFWDRKKHYFDQTLEALAFYEEEWKKITQGLWLNGVFIHPWLYFHTNYFKTPIPMKMPSGKIEEPIINPPMRDNEWYMAENYHAAEIAGRGLFMMGSRRFSKSSLESSILLWNAITRENSTSEIICGAASDLKVVSRFIQIGATHLHPFLALATIKSNWNTHIQFGIRELGTDNVITHSEIFVKNADAGKEKSSEKGAGGAPVCAILDEAAKYDCEEVYLSLMPAIETTEGLKAVVMLSATGGNEKLSKDAYKMLSNPQDYKLLLMNWDLLENKIDDPDAITWTRTKFGMFAPPQMSMVDGLTKIPKTLDKYLKVPDAPELAKIEIGVTDWTKASKLFRDIRESLKNNKTALNKEIVYHPLETAECFLAGSNNPFPVPQARAHKQRLEESGNIGKNVEISRGVDNTIVYTLSDLDRVKFPYGGGIHNAPVVFYEDPPRVVPYRGENVSGLDPYKADQSDTDSVGAFYILGRKLDLKQPLEIIKCSYASRPTTTNMFNRNLEILIEGYNAECMMENADQPLIQYLDAKGKTALLLADGVDWSQSINSSSNPRTRYGFFPTSKNITYMFDLVVSYCWEDVHTFDPETGEDKMILGVELIPDPDLLDEIINWKEKGNFDRIRAFGAALAWARYLDKLRVLPRARDMNQKDLEKMREEARSASRGAMRLPKR